VGLKKWINISNLDLELWNIELDVDANIPTTSSNVALEKQNSKQGTILTFKCLFQDLQRRASTAQ
jgi:hypothetical protein